MVRVELIEEGSSVVERSHDLVVLSGGVLPAYDPRPLYGVPVGDDGFVATPSPNLSPCMTDRPGIFVTGTAAGPMDIVDSIVMSGAAAAEAAAYLESIADGSAAREQRKDWFMPETEHERDEIQSGAPREEIRIGVIPATVAAISAK